MESKLLDIKECDTSPFREIHKEMLDLSLKRQPKWIRPLLLRNRRLIRWTSFDGWSRAWEYPWAIQAAALGSEASCTLDVGSGGSPVPAYLAIRGHESYSTDPSRNEGYGYVFDGRKSVYRNVRSIGLRLLLRAVGIRSGWGATARDANSPVRFFPYAADHLEFPDEFFDRVFCLSVLEHIPLNEWDSCMSEFQRVLKPGGRLVITVDLSAPDADERLYERLTEACTLDLLGDPHYAVPISQEDKEARHPGYGYETLGLVWRKPER